MITRLLQILVVCFLALASVPAAAQTVRDVTDALDSWQIADATAALASYEAARGTSSVTEVLRARIDFLEGRYETATQKLDAVLAREDLPEWRDMRDLIADTHAVTKNFEKHTSPKGYFDIYIEPGRDRVLLPWAFEGLDAAYDALAEELGYRPPTPIRVEVYDKTSVLAKVSVLTEDEIKTSGTIALCKYNRLMITSPRALVRGYGWVDTLVHEYVHYVVNQRTGNQVPIWMHEGLAKFLERRWRGPNAHQLPPHSEHLLQKRTAEGTLITFAQMHPSMAKLPSQEDAAVAFAEVYTAMEYLQTHAGDDAFRRLLDEIANGEEASRAFAKVLGTSFPEFERRWRAELKKRPPIDYPEGAHDEKLIFKDDVSGAAIHEIEQPQARDHINLGQMLQARERFKAAVVQYRKAERLVGTKQPMLQTRLSQSLLADGDAQGAYDALAPIRDTYPGYVSTWIQLGRASYELDRYEEALANLNEAARLNPFDPEIHQWLAAVYEKIGDTKQAEEARTRRKLLQ